MPSKNDIPLDPGKMYFNTPDGLAQAWMRIWDMFCLKLACIKAVLDSCPNRRVVHLALRHRDPLVRKKNMKRLVRLTSKTLKEGKA